MDSGLAGVGFDWQVALANLVNFLIIFWLVKRFAFKPIQKIIRERQGKIEQGLLDADRAERALAEARKNVEEELQKARLEAGEIISSAREREAQIIAEAKNLAEIEHANIVSSAKVKADAEIAKAEKELEVKVAELIALGVKQILEEDMDDKKNKAIVNRALEKIKI